MDTNSIDHNRNLLLGCGTAAAIAAVLFIGALLLLFARDRQAAQYPGATAISSHSNYKGLPFEYKWDDTYLTGDNFTAVYNWYSITFNLGAEMRANDRCILLAGTNPQLVSKRHLSIMLCNTPSGQMIFVSRSTVFGGKPQLNALTEGVRSLFLPKPLPANR